MALTLTLLAFGLRVVGVTHTAPSPYWEEVALGYDAWSIWQTGRDHHGQAWPVVAFTSFGDYKPSLYFYSVVPSVALFGLNTFAVRFPAIVVSALSVGLTSILAYQLTRSRQIAWLAGLLLAIQPWHWWIGRIGFEVNLATFLMLAGVVTLIRHFQLRQQQTRWVWLGVSVLCWCLSMYAYHGARLLAPVLATWTWVTWIDWQAVRRRPVSILTPYLLAAIMAVLCLLPIVLALQSPVVQQRIQETSIFQDPTPVLRANEARAATGNTLVSRVLYHRWWYRTQDITLRWMSHFSPAFLFIVGDQNPRHSSQYFGMLYPWELVTIFLALLMVTPPLRTRLGGWTLLAPAAASVTTGTPHALRAFILSIFLALWSAIGTQWLWQLWRQSAPPRLPASWWNQVGVSSFAAVLMLSVLAAWQYWWYIYPSRYAQEWQYGYQEIVTYLNEHAGTNDPIFLTRSYGRPAMYVWFYTQTPPRDVQAAAATTPKDQGEFLSYGRWQFVNQWPETTARATDTSSWYAGESGTLPSDIKVVHTVYSLRNQPIWDIGVATP